MYVEQTIPAPSAFNFILAGATHVLRTSRELDRDIPYVAEQLMRSMAHQLLGVNDPLLRRQLLVQFADRLFSLFVGELGLRPLQRVEVMGALQRCRMHVKAALGEECDVFERIVGFYARAATPIVPPATGALPPKRTRLQWTGRGRLEELVHQLVDRKLTPSKSALFALFDAKSTTDQRIRWDLSRKDHLALLLHELYAGGFIRAINSKGYFSFAEDHVVGWDGATLRKHALKRRQHAISSEPEKYGGVIAEVGAILKAIDPQARTVQRS